MCMCCGKKWWGLLVLVIGVLMLLKDLKVLVLPDISAWTVLFLIAGLAMTATGMCHCYMPEKKRR